MTPDFLEYPNLRKAIEHYEAKERGEARSFLNWFLENIFRLDAVDADDSICDRENDRGIDGLYVDHTQEEILVLQGKIRQKESSIGDASLRELAGTISQLDTTEDVEALKTGGANPELKQILTRQNIAGLVQKGYSVIGVFVSNQPLDANGQEFLDQDTRIRVYDRNRIAAEFIDIEADGGVKGSFKFDSSYIGALKIDTGDTAKTFVLPVKAAELVKMDGIEDGTLFSQNVRQSLGNTKVNKALRQSVLNPAEHENFPLYHNGVTILCEKAMDDGEALTISNYVVVNGAQSISTFKREEERLSPDLRVIAKIIQLDDANLARRITVNSNNQNAIKPRDLKATNEVQLRLREDFKKVLNGRYDLEIKRGQEKTGAETLITNEEAGRLLLAFDLMEPESCHQVYKLFDDKYSDIFARPSVNAYRIIFLYLVMDRILRVSPSISYKPLSKYGLTRFFLLSVISEMMRNDEIGKDIFKNPSSLFHNDQLQLFLDAVEEIIESIVIDLNYEVEDLGETFDYKGDLKSPNKIREIRSKLLRSFDKDVARKKAKSIKDLFAE